MVNDATHKFHMSQCIPYLNISIKTKPYKPHKIDPKNSTI